MKSEIKESIEEKYPYLGIYKGGSFIVLFSAKDTGTVVFDKESKGYSIGYFSKTWGEEYFTLFNGIVKLSN